MNKIMELRNKRNTLWEQTKNFLEEHRGDNGLVEASAVEQYNKMAADVQALGAEIERLEQQAAFDAQLSQPTTHPVTNKPMSRKAENVAPTATDEYAGAFWNMIRNQGDQFAVRNALSVGEDTEGGYTVPDEFERKLVQALEENNIFRQLATVIRTNSGTRKIPIANDTMEAQWIDEGEEIPETNTKFGQTTLSAYKLGTMIKISNELLHDSAFDLASYIAARFGVCMGNAEERAFFTGDGDKKPLGMAVTKKIEIDGNLVEFKASAAIPRIYRNKFGRDVYKDLMVLNDAIKDQDEEASTLDGFSLEMFEDLAFVMWSAAHPDQKYDSPDEWLDQFNTFSIYQILPELIDLWGMNIKTTVPARKN